MKNHWIKPKNNFLPLILPILLFGGLVAVNLNREPALEAEAIYQEIEQTPHYEAPVAKLSTSGVASWYNYSLDGIEWSKSHSTCASRTLPRYSTAIVTNLDNGKSVECFVNDYIEHPDREIDLSSFAFSQIANLSQGLANVKIELK